MKRAISLLAALAVSLCAYAQHSFVVGRTELKGADTGLFRMDSYYWGEGVVSSGSTPLLGMEQTLSSGSALADIRAITYEDGAPVIEDGRLYLSGSTRTGGSGIAIVALTLGTGELEFTGTLNCLMAGEFWKICAPHIMYDRTRKLWQVTTPMHAPTDHHLWIATANNDLRFGVSTLEFSPLDYKGPKKGDEDCQIFYDKAMRRWVMIYASTRRPDDGSGYILRLQTSKRPDGGFRDYSYQTDVSATGVTTTLIGGTRYVLSGNMRGPVSNLNGGGKSGSGGDLRSAGGKPDSSGGNLSSTDSDKPATERNRYSVWSYPDMEFVCDLDIDIDDGAFRGWNNLTPVPEGDATRYVMLGFDRQATTDEDNWTYGNNYFLYSRQLNPGLEFAQKDADGKVTRAASTSFRYGVQDLQLLRRGSRRFCFQDILLGRIDLEYDITAPKGNLYPALPVTAAAPSILRYDKGRIYPEGGSGAAILAGIHHPLANYLMPIDAIADGDSRYLYIGSQDGHCAARVIAQRKGPDIEVRFEGSEGSVILGSFPCPVNNHDTLRIFMSLSNLTARYSCFAICHAK